MGQQNFSRGVSALLLKEVQSKTATKALAPLCLLHWKRRLKNESVAVYTSSKSIWDDILASKFENTTLEEVEA